MIVRPADVRRLLRLRLADGQVAESAVVAFSAALEELAAMFAEESARSLQSQNELRAMQRLEPVRRLTDAHVPRSPREAPWKVLRRGPPLPMTDPSALVTTSLRTTVLSLVGPAGLLPKVLKPPRPMPSSCAEMGETQVWQSASGATVSMVVTLDELPQPILRNDDRNPWEMQPAASDTDNGPDEHTVRVAWRPVFDKWDAYLERKAPGTRREYTQKARATFEWVEASLGKSDLREVTWEDLEGLPACLELKATLEAEHGQRVGLRDSELLPARGRPTRNAPARRARPGAKAGAVLPRGGQPGEGEPGAYLQGGPPARARRRRGRIGLRLVPRRAVPMDDHRPPRGPVDRDVGPGRTRTPAQGDVPAAVKARLERGETLDAGLARRLKEWKRLKDPQPEDPVFRDPLTSKKVYLNLYNRRFKEYAARAGLKVRVSSHTLRRSANTHGLLQGVPELFLQRQGAWAVRDAWDAYCLQPMETYREAVKSLALGLKFGTTGKHAGGLSDMVDAEGSMNLYQGDERTSTASPTARARVFAYLDEHPELARKPGEVAARLHVTTGYAKRLLHDWRKAHRPSLDSLPRPRPPAERAHRRGNRPRHGLPRFPPLVGSARGPRPLRHGDHKLTAAVPLPHLEGAAEGAVVGGSTLELRLLSPRGFTLSEVHLVLALLGLPFDRDAEAAPDLRGLPGRGVGEVRGSRGADLPRRGGSPPQGVQPRGRTRHPRPRRGASARGQALVGRARGLLPSGGSPSDATPSSRRSPSRSGRTPRPCSCSAGRSSGT